MRTASGLALVAIGAILAFAVTASPSFLNLQVTGWVIMLTGIVGMVVPRRGYGWLRRRVVVRRPSRGGPGDLARTRPALGIGGVMHRRPGPPDTLIEPQPSRASTESAVVAQPAEETVEEFFEE